MERRETHSSPEKFEMCLNSLQGEYQLDLFQKLGYAKEQVNAVLQKFGEHTDTNRVLGELVRTGASAEVKEGLVTTMSVLVPRDDGTFKTPNLLLPMCPQTREQLTVGGEALRPIVIDGSNVAMSHGNKEVFSCLGILLAVNFFLDRGHTDITVFVPSWRKEQPRPDAPITDQRILRDLERKKILVFTPSRRVAGKRVVCYDDRFIVKLAYESDGVIVSNDTYRDLQGENPEWKRFIEEKLLMYSFVNNKFMPPDDPLGRHGPTLENFLRRTPKTLKKHLCPYGKKCTYGIKCKFHHPERINQSSHSLADELREKARLSQPFPKQSSVGSGPGSTLRLPLEEEMMQKLSLEHCSGSLKKGHTSENVLVRAAPRSGRKGPLRKEIATSHQYPPDLDSFSSSREKLDSGYGSVDSQPNEHCTQRYREKYRSCQSAPNKREQYRPPQSAPCSCFAHAPPSLVTTGCFQQHSHSMGSPRAHNPDIMSYSLTHYPTCGASVYPINKPAYSHPTHFQHNHSSVPPKQTYCSDPFGIYSPSMPEERSPWERPHGDERQNVRKKLLAIFHVHLVDRAMERFPEVMDPQMLAAEILMLQGQGRAL